MTLIIGLFCWIIEQANLAPLSDEDTRLLDGQVARGQRNSFLRMQTHIDAVLGSGEEVRLTITAC
jgi:molecular chaperone HscA